MVVYISHAVIFLFIRLFIQWRLHVETVFEEEMQVYASTVCLPGKPDDPVPIVVGQECTLCGKRICGISGYFFIATKENVDAMVSGMFILPEHIVFPRSEMLKEVLEAGDFVCGYDDAWSVLLQGEWKAAVLEY